YRYDGRDRVRYDAETGLYWMSVRAYDPTLGRFISHDPLGRLAAAELDSEPYVYGGNNPLTHVDPSGMREIFSDGTRMTKAEDDLSRQKVRTAMTWGAHNCNKKCQEAVRASLRQVEPASSLPVWVQPVAALLMAGGALFATMSMNSAKEAEYKALEAIAA